MNNNQALASLIDHIDGSSKPASLCWDELQRWQEGVLANFVEALLLVKTVNSRSVACTACEHGCYMEVHLADDDSQRAFIVCDHPEMQSQMGRINVPMKRLTQWQSSVRCIAEAISCLLGFTEQPEFQKASASFKLGMLAGNKGRRWVSINAHPLSLEINRRKVSVKDLLYFDQGKLVIDDYAIVEMLNSTASHDGKEYRPDISKQASRKLATQAMYQDWRDAYLALKKKHPQKSDTWCSIQIAKMAIAKDKDSETIRKRMKT